MSFLLSERREAGPTEPGEPGAPSKWGGWLLFESGDLMAMRL